MHNVKYVLLVLFGMMVSFYHWIHGNNDKHYVFAPPNNWTNFSVWSYSWNFRITPEAAFSIKYYHSVGRFQPKNLHYRRTRCYSHSMANDILVRRNWKKARRNKLNKTTQVILIFRWNYSRTLLARTPWNHEKMFETGVVQANEC